MTKLDPKDIFNLIYFLDQSIMTLMCNQYGNYFCQKLFKQCNQMHKMLIMSKVYLHH